MKKLRIGYFADGIWGHNAFLKIQKEQSIEVAFICPRCDTKDEKLQIFAERYGIDYIQTHDVNSEEFLNKIDSYECDLLVSMSFNQIFKAPILNKYKIINCHAGKLPFYRGRNILNWVLINDEKEFGITVHFVDEGIDTGDIIVQKTFPITENDTYATLLDVAHVQCAQVLHEALMLCVSGQVPTQKQADIHPVGMYCGMRTVGDEIFHWDMPSREIYNFIRAICKPGPMATCALNGKPFYINRAELIYEAPLYKGIAGQVLYKENECLIVKTQDSILKITEFYFDKKVKIGDRLQ